MACRLVTERLLRAGSLRIDVETLTGELYGHPKALGALRQARTVAPQQTRYHPSVHETVRILAETDARATDSLAGFARWLGVTI